MVKRPKNVQIWVIGGLSATLVACTGEAGTGDRPTRFLNVQPIQVCDDLGFLCADLALFEEATRKIWQQANIAIEFLNPTRLNASRFLTLDSEAEFAEISFAGGTGAFGRHPLSTRTTGPLNLWFVEDIFVAEDYGETLGLGWIDQNGVAVSDNILNFNNGLGRLDTVAHEIGHNLGLTHTGLGAGGSNNLMTDGSVRNSPSTLGDITPDGARYDQLNSEQIRFARESRLLGDRPGLQPDMAPARQATVPSVGLVAAADQETPLAIAPTKKEPVVPQGKEIPVEWSPVMVQIPESDPLVQWVAVSPVFPRLGGSSAPQAVPNGPALSGLTALLVALYLARSR